MSVTETREESTYERIREELEASGEVMVRTASGDELELHKHNVEFEAEPFLQIGTDDEVHWLDATAVERYWIHGDL